jgi:hypothetical protein
MVKLLYVKGAGARPRLQTCADRRNTPQDSPGNIHHGFMWFEDSSTPSQEPGSGTKGESLEAELVNKPEKMLDLSFLPAKIIVDAD